MLGNNIKNYSSLYFFIILLLLSYIKNFSCVDKLSGRRIRKKLCGPKSERPVGRKRKCNTFACDFHWMADQWEHCTTSCGLKGVQSRQIYCIPSKQNITDQLWAHLVDPKKCRADGEGNIQVVITHGTLGYSASPI